MLPFIKNSPSIIVLLLLCIPRGLLAFDVSRLEVLKKEAHELALNAADNPVSSLLKAPPPATKKPRNIWCASSGTTLKSSIEEWQKTVEWVTQWQSEYDYPILAKICFKGTFDHAITGFIKAYKDAEHPLYINMYPEQRLAVITD